MLMHAHIYWTMCDDANNTKQKLANIFSCAYIMETMWIKKDIYKAKSVGVLFPPLQFTKK